MSVRLNWTSESEKTFNQNLDYLSKEWDLPVLNGFLDRVEEALEHIPLALVGVLHQQAGLNLKLMLIV
ncbi:MAG: hypothetical protein DYG99_12665 [Bacteroidetes bacterium CHB5]|nr:hypothetical protein [Bacteroidetes bacterium CHB5]